LVSTLRVDSEIHEGGLDCIPGMWAPDDRALIREASKKLLAAGEESAAPLSPLEVRRAVRRAALDLDVERLLPGVIGQGAPVSREIVGEEIRRLRQRLRRLSPEQWQRLVGVSTLRWVAATREEASRSVYFMAIAVRTHRNTLDRASSDIWAKHLDSSVFSVTKESRARLLWHLHLPTLEDCQHARPYLQACLEAAVGEAHEADLQVKSWRLQHDRQQRIAVDAWVNLCMALCEAAPPGSAPAQELLAYAVAHLEAELRETPIGERSLFDRLVYANRPDGQGRRALRPILERWHAALVPAWDAMNKEAVAADHVRDGWHDALDAYQRSLEQTSDFLDHRDIFLRSLVDAHRRSTKG
jgi:hypothetical protein